MRNQKTRTVKSLTNKMEATIIIITSLLLPKVYDCDTW